MVERVLGKNELDSSKLDVNKTFIYLQLPDNLPLPVEGSSRAYFDGSIGGDTIRFGNGGKIPLPGKAYFARYAVISHGMLICAKKWLIPGMAMIAGRASSRSSSATTHVWLCSTGFAASLKTAVGQLPVAAVAMCS